MTSKLTEYFGLRRPILMLAPAGPGARLVRVAGAGLVAAPDDESAIASAVVELYDDWLAGSERVVAPEVAAAWTRRATARSIAMLLDAAADHRR
jgi:hypothetical protein